MVVTTAVALFWLTIRHHPSRNVAAVSTPSPSQSHASALSPPLPYRNVVSAVPVVSVLRRNHVGWLGADARPSGSCSHALGVKLPNPWTRQFDTLSVRQPLTVSFCVMSVN